MTVVYYDLVIDLIHAGFGIVYNLQLYISTMVVMNIRMVNNNVLRLFISSVKC
jgi:hypothetical protein